MATSVVQGQRLVSRKTGNAVRALTIEGDVAHCVVEEHPDIAERLAIEAEGCGKPNHAPTRSISIARLLAESL